MPITREFLDWSEPALPMVGDWLIGRFSKSGVVDLQGVVVVMPGGRAGRRLLEILVERATNQTLDLIPPRIETMGRLPELLYEAKRPFAGDLVQKLAWGKALRSVDRQLVTQIIPELPSEDDTLRWLTLGELLWRQHRELAADGLQFSDVAKLGQDVDGFDESERWRILSQIQREYLDTLDGLGLWDLQTARLFAIEHRECRSDSEIVLVTTTDMNRAVRAMLDQIVDRVTALIHAPETLADRFDVYGCIEPEAWQSVRIDVPTECVHVVDGPADQAEAVARSLAALEGRYRADDVTIGLADETIVPQIQGQLTQCGVASRWVVGTPLRQTAPFRLFKAAADLLERGRFADFAGFVRHPDVCHRLDQRHLAADPMDVQPDGSSGNERRFSTGWLTQLDEYYAEHLQPRLGRWLGPAHKHERVKQVYEDIQGLLAPLHGKPQKLADWTPALLDLLQNVYDGIAFDLEDPTDRTTVAACDQIHSALNEHAAVPESLSPTLTPSQAIRLTLEEMESGELPPPADETAIELLGWLELPLDDAPALVVTTVNERYVPKSLNSDLFLPNALRRRLGVVDNLRRYARDAYALSVLVASRKELTLIVARRDSRGDPLAPSRLLFATDAQSIAERVLAFYKADPAARLEAPLLGTLTSNRQSSGFAVPPPEPLPRPIERISVTAFRSYLACPYRFYLRHVLNLGPLDDDAKELDAPSFGSLMHEVLGQFGHHAVRGSLDSEEIRDFLREALKQCVRDLYGGDRLAPVNVQIRQLQTRLDAFAKWQAGWAKEGWRIEFTEAPPNGDPVRFPVDDGRHIELRGRIDRIDRYRDHDEWVIFDYKSSDTAKSPESVHREKKSRWVDLQLPLYRFLAGSLGIEGQISLGYITIPKDTKKVGHQLAEWTEEELKEADAVAVDVARRILGQEFWPPAEPPPRILTDYAAICQDTVFEKR